MENEKYLDLIEKIKMSIFLCFRELLGQAWMKPDKGNKAPHVLLVSKRFNEVSV